MTLVIPGNASRERLDRIASHGARIVETDPIEGYDFAITEAQRLAREHPDRYWYADQYSNDNNWLAHYETTGVEIVEQTRAQTGTLPDAFVCGVGTGGTLTGVGRRLREANRDVHLAVIDPETSSGAYVHAAIALARRGDFRVVVTTLNDTGERYGSTGMWQRETEHARPRAVSGGARE